MLAGGWRLVAVVVIGGHGWWLWLMAGGWWLWLVADGWCCGWWLWLWEAL